MKDDVKYALVALAILLLAPVVGAAIVRWWAFVISFAFSGGPR